MGAGTWGSPSAHLCVLVLSTSDGLVGARAVLPKASCAGGTRSDSLVPMSGAWVPGAGVHPRICCQLFAAGFVVTVGEGGVLGGGTQRGGR